MASNENRLNQGKECGACGGFIPAGTPLRGGGIHWDAAMKRWKHDDGTCPPPAKAAPVPGQSKLPGADAPSQAPRPMNAAPSGPSDLAKLSDGELLLRYGCTRAQYDIVRNHIAKKLNPDQLDYFLSVSKMRGLSPWAKQVYAMVYKSRSGGEDSLVIQTGIDGFRRIAVVSGQCDGIDEPTFGPEVDSEGVRHPEWARVQVWRKGASHPFTATVRWSEYRKVERQGDKTVAKEFWMTMPYGQLGKCAESAAIRKGFPEFVGGLYTHEEMEQASNTERERVEIIDTSGRDATPPALSPATPSPPAAEHGDPKDTPPEGSVVGGPSKPAGGPQASNLEDEVPGRALGEGDPAVKEMVHEIEGMLNPAGNAELGKRRREFLPMFLRAEKIAALADATPADLEGLDRIRTLLLDVP